MFDVMVDGFFGDTDVKFGGWVTD